MTQTRHRATSFRGLLLLLMLFFSQALLAATQNPKAVSALLNRIGGEGTSKRFVTIVDENLAKNGNDAFVITSRNGKPCIKGNNVIAVATGINWYLNHYANINLSWNRLTTNLSGVVLPVPAKSETHTCNVDYRYYLNYCTFSYSMSVWTWERWQKEIDWMALHGINMPLQIVGLDVVWKNLLTKDLGYSIDEANKFIAGPCFQAWWGMNNMEGWGGPNRNWWYARQERLCKQILARQRELGMEPVLPGYSGMVPSDLEKKKGIKTNSQGPWCSFTRPYILDPNSAAFSTISAHYYKRLKELMGTSEYYSMDPFHEGGNTAGIDVPSAYENIAKSMFKANANAKWVIQFWQWSRKQYNVLEKVDKGKLIVLDLYSDAHTHFGEYQGHDAVYCIIPNFGGRSGLFGRLTKVMDHFFAMKQQYGNIKGIGATPEAIEQAPVLYDALFELPWYESAPDAKTWLSQYATSRYGKQNEMAQAAWEKIRNSALNCPTALQGPHEAVYCARPSLDVGSVSSWGGTEIFYQPQDVITAACKMLQAKGELEGDNYDYDLTDFTRQALTDYANFLLKSIKEAATSGNKKAYATRRDAFLQLILDIDRLLCSNSNFMLGKWTNMARNIANEAKGTTEADRQWMELDNARTLITTWGNRNASEQGGLRDYSYRAWGGMLKDFYYKRWEAFFNSRDNGTPLPDWFDNDWAWAHNSRLTYPDEPTGNTADIASRLLKKYFLAIKQNGAETAFACRFLDSDMRKELKECAYRGSQYSFPLEEIPEGVTASLGIDLDNDGIITDEETFNGTSALIPPTASTATVLATLSLSDGTCLKFKLSLKDHINKPRTVAVCSNDEKQGSASIDGQESPSVTNTDDVVLIAKAKAGYDFQGWTNEKEQIVSNENPFTYSGADAATFTANFVVNKWGSPKENLNELSVVSNYGQYVKQISAILNDGNPKVIYETPTCPQTLCHTSQVINVPQGATVKIPWTGAGGLNYCNVSMYIDWNADGDFDDGNELIGVIGTKQSSDNAPVNDNTLSLLLPYNMPTGITHIRLRFDGAWAKGYDKTTGAMPAKAETDRMIYDIPVNVTSQANTPCTITAKSENPQNGTVDANGQPDTYTYSIGEEVVLRAYPVKGYAVEWTDKYGRPVPKKWVDGNFLRFRAPESGTYTARFKTVKRSANNR